MFLPGRWGRAFLGDPMGPIFLRREEALGQVDDPPGHPLGTRALCSIWPCAAGWKGPGCDFLGSPLPYLFSGGSGALPTLGFWPPSSQAACQNFLHATPLCGPLPNICAGTCPRRLEALSQPGADLLSAQQVLTFSGVL